jgi:hypothetical protein
MGDSTKTTPRPLAVLGLPEYRVPLLVARARFFVSCVRKSSWFPAPDPPLTTVDAAIEALHQTQAATLSRLAGTVAKRDKKRRDLVVLLQRLQAYVQKIGDANDAHAVEIIESAGMSVKKPPGGRGRVFTAKQWRESGSAEVLVPRGAKYDTYEWQMSTDGTATWNDLPPSQQASTVVRGLMPDTTVFFRYRVVMKMGPGDWSHPVSLRVR